MAYVHNSKLKELLTIIYKSDCGNAKDEFFCIIQSIAIDQAIRRGINDRETLDDFTQFAMIKIIKLLNEKRINPEDNVYGFLTLCFANKAKDFKKAQKNYQNRNLLMDQDQWDYVLDKYEKTPPHHDSLDVDMDLLI